MRLLRWSGAGQVSFTKDFVGDDMIPRYAILSHTWGKDVEEVTFEDLKSGNPRPRLAIRRSGSVENKPKKMAWNIFGSTPVALYRSSTEDNVLRKRRHPPPKPTGIITGLLMLNLVQAFLSS
jgi:hypothetical protein